MWIIPKTLSAFVQDTEGLRLALDERAWMLEQSAMWRSKPSSKQTWLRRLKKDAWMTHLSGRILKPSLHESFVEKYTDSLEDIHASRSVARGSEKEKKTQGTYGPISESTSGQLDLFGAFSKTSEVTPRWGYGESCPIWKKMVTERSLDCTQRRKQARHTNASDASSWPTAQTSDSNGAADPTRKAHRTQLRDVETGHLPQGKSWPTPTTAEAGKISNQANYGQQGLSNHPSIVGLPKRPKGEKDRKKNWATPQASDHIEGARTAKESNQKCLGRDLNQMENWPTPRAGNPGSRKPGTGGKILAEEAKKNWSTPLEDDSSNVNPNAKRRTSLVKEVNQQSGPPAPDKSSTIGKNHGSWPTPNTPSGGPTKGCPQGMNGGKGHREMMKGVFKETSPKLNPNWVEQLMGLEVGWTQLPTEWIDSDS